uniref:Peptidase_M14 domain-containing protein n=1 Tax=Onchocerca volvulus TaxID=6282 RepID=A0A8R1TLG2_ONCVO
MIIFYSIFLLLIAFKNIASIISETKRTYSVLRIIPENDEQLEFLSTLYLTDDEMVDFWKPPTRINETVDIMVNPGIKDELNHLLEMKSISYHIEVDDFEKYLQSKQEMLPWRNKSFHKERRLWDDNTKNSNIFLGKYHSFDDIISWLKNLEKQNPDIVTVISIGTTYEGRKIYGVKLGTKNFNSKPVVWIDAGIHAREWASIHTALYFIKQLIREHYSSPKIEQYLKLLDIYIFPCLNPDGYEYTRTKPHHPSIRLWRKNRRSTNYYKWKNGRKQYCEGVDLNRNFDFHFAEVGSSSAACSQIYHGRKAFSEPETQAIRDAILRLRKRMKAYMTLHTYSQLWIYPFSNRRRSYSSDIDDLKAVAKKAVESIKKLYGTKYEYGTGPEVIYAFSGGSSDWVKATAKVKYSYTIELRPSRSSLDGFILNKRELIPLGRETYEGIKVVINKVIAEAKEKHGM